MTAEEIKNDIEVYDDLYMILEKYTDEVQQLRQNAKEMTIDFVVYYLPGAIQKRALAFFPYRTLSAQVLIDCLEQHINDIKSDMAVIREKYKGVIDFEN